MVAGSMFEGISKPSVVNQTSRPFWWLISLLKKTIVPRKPGARQAPCEHRGSVSGLEKKSDESKRFFFGKAMKNDENHKL